MSWTIGTVTAKDASTADPETLNVSVTQPRNQIFLCTLQGADGRDKRWNTNTFAGNNATLAGFAEQDNDPTFATVAVYYYVTSGLTNGTKVHYHECTTGGPDDGSGLMHVLITGCAPSSTVTATETANAETGNPSDTIAVANNGSLLVSVYTSQRNADFTVPSGHTSLFNNLNPDSEGVRLGASYKVCNVGTETVTWGAGGSDKWAMVCMVIKPDNSGGGFLISLL